MHYHVAIRYWKKDRSEFLYRVKTMRGVISSNELIETNELETDPSTKGYAVLDRVDGDVIAVACIGLFDEKMRTGHRRIEIVAKVDDGNTVAITQSEREGALFPPPPAVVEEWFGGKLRSESEIVYLCERLELSDTISTLMANPLTDLDTFVLATKEYINLGTLASRLGGDYTPYVRICQRGLFNNLTVEASYDALIYAHQPQHRQLMYPVVLSFCHSRIKEFVSNRLKLMILGMDIMQDVIDLSLETYEPPAFLASP